MQPTQPTPTTPETRPAGEGGAGVLGYAPVPRGAGTWLRGRWGVRMLVLAALIVAGVIAYRIHRWRLAEDEKAFKSVATINGTAIRFNRPPTDGALRHAQRLSAITELRFEWDGDPDTGASVRLRGRKFPQIQTIRLYGSFNADPWLKELARADSGLTALTMLDLRFTDATDAGVKELARPDSGLKGLTTLDVRWTRVTDARVKELQRARPGLIIRR